MSRLTTAFAVLVILAALAPPASAQAVAFQPVVSAFPNGVTLSATPVVSADRRYVRLSVNPQFNALEGFDAYSVPAAVSGGGFRNVGMPGMTFGMDGPVGLDSTGYGYSYGYGYGDNAGPNPGYFPGPSPTASAFLSGAAGYAPAGPRFAPVNDPPRPKATRKPPRTKRPKTR